MRKVLSLVLAIMFIVTCFAGCKGKPEDGSSQMTLSTEFEKPDEYAATLIVRINPQFKLYLDTSFKVLALEAVNVDAKEAIKNIDFIANEGLDSIIKKILAASKNSGFMQENANISFEIGEIKDEKIESENLLQKSKEYAEKAVTDLKIIADVTVPALEEKGQEETNTEGSSSDKSGSSSDSTSGTSSNQGSSSTPKDTSDENPKNDEHKHSYTSKVTAATCKDKGYTQYTCSCGDSYKEEGKALGDHSFKNGKCTVCGKEDILAIDGNLKFDEEYIGKYTINGTELTRIEIIVEANKEFIVFTTHYYTEDPSDGGTPFQYNGKNYYSQGGGHSPYYVEFKDTEILAKDMNTNEVVAKFVLQSDGQLKATFCNTEHFVAGDLFKIGG